MPHGFGETVRSGRERCGWSINVAAQAAHVSNKSWGDKEAERSLELIGMKDWKRRGERLKKHGAIERKMIAFLEAYGFEFLGDFTGFSRMPDRSDLNEISIDLRDFPNPDNVGAEMRRAVDAIGFHVVQMHNRHRRSGSKYDTITIQVPPLNVHPLEIVLERFVDDYGNNLHCRVRDCHNVVLSPDVISSLFQKSQP